MKKPTNKIIADGRTIYVAKYHNIENARIAQNRSRKNWLILGDVDDVWGSFWIVRPVDAARLVDAGYEMAGI